MGWRPSLQGEAAAQASAPGAQLTDVRVPTQGREPAWRIGLKERSAPAPRSVRVVDATGEVQAEDAARRADSPGPSAAQDALSPLVRRIHDGHEMGLAWQLVIFAAGLAPPLFGLSGLAMWLRRRARRRAIRQGPA